MSDRKRHQELAAFLRSRRERLTPAQVGLASYKHRRTPGLRREEVAFLANISTSWYTSLEQGREIHPSKVMLDNVAQALQLTPDERAFLLLLANEDSSFVSSTHLSQQASPFLQEMLNDVEPKPAYIMGRYWNYVAWNRAAEAVFTVSQGIPPYEDNVIWRLFADPGMQTFFRDWEFLAQKVVSLFRADSARFCGDATFKRLIDDLHQVSKEFRCWWSHFEVCKTFECHKEIDHPKVGQLRLEHFTFCLPRYEDFKLMIYAPCREHNTASKLQQLLSMKIDVEG